MVSSVGSNGQVFTAVLSAGDQFDPNTNEVTHLTHREVATEIKTAEAIITLVRGTISFAEDNTTVYVSAVSGKK